MLLSTMLLQALSLGRVGAALGAGLAAFAAAVRLPLRPEPVSRKRLTTTG